MTDIGKYIPVEGVGGSGHWEDVALCESCLRVVASIKELKVKENRSHTWKWARIEPPTLCSFCGHRLRHLGEGNNWNVLLAVGRWHWTPELFRPWHGHWEIRDFNKYLAKQTAEEGRVAEEP